MANDSKDTGIVYSIPQSKNLVHSDAGQTNYSNYFEYPIVNQPQSFRGNENELNLELNLTNSNNPKDHGIEKLTWLEKVFIKQKINFIEIFTKCEMKKSYDILSKQNEMVFKAKEESTCSKLCTVNSCKTFQNIDLKDSMGNIIIHIERPKRCLNCFFPFFLEDMNIYSPPGNLIGKVNQKWSLRPKFIVKDELEKVIFIIEGPLILCSSPCYDVEFKILSLNGSNGIGMGSIKKKWNGCIKESISDADYIELEFPTDINTKLKANLIGACFLISSKLENITFARK